MSVSVHANTSDATRFPLSFLLIDLMLEVALNPQLCSQPFSAGFLEKKKPAQWCCNGNELFKGLEAPLQ